MNRRDRRAAGRASAERRPDWPSQAGSAVANMMALGSDLMARSDEEIDAMLASTRAEGVEAAGDVAAIFAAHWARNGFPRVSLEARHAAALMATRTPTETVADARAPWDAFAIEVPRGLAWFAHPDGEKQIVNACVLIIEAGAFIFYGDEQGAWFSAAATSLAQLGEFMGEGPAPEVLARLALGVCLEMTENRPSTSPALAPLSIKRGKRGAPQPNAFVLTRDVRIDCRASVASYVRGERATAPAVQCLVRGHWKRQAHGHDRAQRRMIFVEPYWRGPELGALVMRAHRLPTPPIVDRPEGSEAGAS